VVSGSGPCYATDARHYWQAQETELALQDLKDQVRLKKYVHASARTDFFGFADVA
jgi:hypothetical protein